MNTWMQTWLNAMAEATERRARLEREYKRTVIAGARKVRVEHARILAPQRAPEAPIPQTAAPPQPLKARRFMTPKSWDKPDGFELLVFRPPGTRVYVPPHLYMTTDWCWRRWEVP